MKKTTALKALLLVAVLATAVSLGVQQRRLSRGSPPSPQPAAPVSSTSVSLEPAASVVPGKNAATEPGTPAAPAKVILRSAGPTAGQPLAPLSPEYLRARAGGLKPEGRATPLDRESFAALRTLRVGDRILLPLAAGETVPAIVNLVQEEGGTVRIGGGLTDGEEGSFSLHTDGGRVGGRILRPSRGLAYRIEQDGAGAAALREVLLSEVLCAQMPRMKNEPPRAASVSAVAVPIHNSRPSAVAQFYLDFDGQTVADPDWNGGNPIVAASSTLTSAEITEVFQRVTEDYLPFNINITTDVAKYNSAPIGRRMRCIITPTDTAGPGFGGIAYVYSFAQAGTDFSNNIPCWVFNTSLNGVAEAVSHELGHTLGLNHDGREIPDFGHEEYFAGHGSGATSWGPIMGAAYNVSVSQWSRGEYEYANNLEDDLAIITSSLNGFGYVADEAGNAIGSAAVLNAGDGVVSQSGVITFAADTDVYSFTTTGGSVTINASNAEPRPNLDIRLELLSSSFTVLAQNNVFNVLDASITATLSAGTYYLRISGSGAGSPLTSGYSSYGSIGAYTFTGTVPGGVGHTIHVNRTYTGVFENGSQAAPFRTMAPAVAAAQPGDTVRVFGGHYPPALATGKTLRLERWERPGGIVKIGQ